MSYSSNSPSNNNNIFLVIDSVSEPSSPPRTNLSSDSLITLSHAVSQLSSETFIHSNDLLRNSSLISQSRVSNQSFTNPLNEIDPSELDDEFSFNDNLYDLDSNLFEKSSFKNIQGLKEGMFNIQQAQTFLKEKVVILGETIEDGIQSINIEDLPKDLSKIAFINGNNLSVDKSHILSRRVGEKISVPMTDPLTGTITYVEKTIKLMTEEESKFFEHLFEICSLANHPEEIAEKHKEHAEPKNEKTETPREPIILSHDKPITKKPQPQAPFSSLKEELQKEITKREIRNQQQRKDNEAKQREEIDEKNQTILRDEILKGEIKRSELNQSVVKSLSHVREVIRRIFKIILPTITGKEEVPPFKHQVTVVHLHEKIKT